ncbi:MULTISPECIES: TetR/AcrR family transcriptional regulator [unclassified Pseudoclavibacter]|uniref:TetR/AcrR family transcriptional regulator n=1 Tax=unclassified Pseudoclavibacter TaxID=2615177 RepID=UPI0013010E5C|nr:MULTISPECIES: TetR family transcriptional regulator [unclassified Pseudoclavibacter]KAB1646239.1 TetR family transcriptional regulator [Pseudoclavibacter sp. CFCC 14310]KAB1663597.1 TetR family transcriptional regulator [Pseudoclavibacter sp. CFCC 13611]
MTFPLPKGRSRRSDPDRRDRLIDACLEVITSVGVAGTSARRVAAAADVPLGSVTYHFTSMDELMHEAFTRFSICISEIFETYLRQSGSRDQAAQAVVALIECDVLRSTRVVRLTHELYALAARNTAYQPLTTAWMVRSRDALQKHFDSTTARILDALIEGLILHRALDEATPPENLAADAIARIISAQPDR